MTKVSVCIPTYNRNTDLFKLLESIFSNSYEGFFIDIVIADNTAKKNAEKVFLYFDDLCLNHESINRIHYLHVPEKGLSVVRNNLLEYSVSVSDYIIFVDDDEFVGDNFIIKHFETLNNYNAGIVLGAVVPVFDEKLSWFSDPVFYQQIFESEGDTLGYCASNNTLMKVDVLIENNAKFDLFFNLLGGEDQDFYGRLISNGVKVVGSNASFVYEKVPQNRQTKRWLLKRSFRKGNTLGLISMRKKSLSSIFYRILSVIFNFFVFVLSIPLCLFKGRKFFLFAFIRFFFSLGAFLGLIGFRYKAYK